MYEDGILNYIGALNFIWNTVILMLISQHQQTILLWVQVKNPTAVYSLGWANEISASKTSDKRSYSADEVADLQKQLQQLLKLGI
jgi:hypothetical protein